MPQSGVGCFAGNFSMQLEELQGIIIHYLAGCQLTSKKKEFQSLRNEFEYYNFLMLLALWFVNCTNKYRKRERWTNVNDNLIEQGISSLFYVFFRCSRSDMLHALLFNNFLSYMNVQRRSSAIVAVWCSFRRGSHDIFYNCQIACAIAAFNIKCILTRRRGYHVFASSSPCTANNVEHDSYLIFARLSAEVVCYSFSGEKPGWRHGSRKEGIAIETQSVNDSYSSSGWHDVERNIENMASF